MTAAAEPLAAVRWLVVERTLTQRSAELPAAHSIVRAEVGRFTRWLSRRQTATALRQRVSESRRA